MVMYGIKASDNACKARKETELVKDYILLPLWTADPSFSQDPKSSHDDGSKPSSKYRQDVIAELRKVVKVMMQRRKIINFNDVRDDVSDIDTLAIHGNHWGMIAWTHPRAKMDLKKHKDELKVKIEAAKSSHTRKPSKDLDASILKKRCICQPPGFEDPDFPDRVYKVEKALYGLHQAPRAWYETLSTYLLDNGFQRGKIDKTLFIKRYKSDILLVQV
ncbi:retrovirus-related pol polyprotein from transposon TNT 1-94 [Tanacetum coccineum]